MKTETKVKLIGAGLFIGFGGCIQVLHPAFYQDLWHILLSGDMQETVSYIHSFGVWAMVFSFFLTVLVNALGFLPAIFFSTANALLFGLVEGILLSWLAETVGVLFSFLLMRNVLRSSAERLIVKNKRLAKIDEFSGKNGFQIMLIARAVPYFPSGIVTALGAISKISLRDYAVSNLIGKLPSTLLEVLICYDILLQQKNIGHLVTAAVLSVLIYGFAWWYRKQENSLAEETVKTEEKVI